MSTKSKAAPPHRVRLSVPVTDTSTLEWLARQDNASQSMRALVRDYIERHGYTDPTSRPVRQLPRRGRPPLEESYIPEDVVGEEAEPPEELRQAREATQPPRVREARETPPVRPEKPKAQPHKETQPPAPALVPAPVSFVQSDDPGSTPGASGVGSFLAASRDDD